MQQTIANELKIEGVGLHSGIKSTLTLKPAKADTGIVFVRTDIDNAEPILATYNNVIDTKNCTCIGYDRTNMVSTIEHLMAALYIMQIDNIVVEIDALEMPIVDGSSQLFLQKLQQVGTTKLKAAKKYIKVMQKVEASDDKGNSVVLEPADDFYINFVIEFPSKIVGRQEFDGVINQEIFAKEIAPCRTY